MSPSDGLDVAAPVTDDSAAPARTSRGLVAFVADHRSVDLVLVVVMPVVVLAVLRVSPFFRLNNGDPYIYTGYANDFVGHVRRYGYTYYSVRFGLIFPLRAALVLGPVWGYFALRWLLYLLAMIPMHLALRSRSRALALVGPLLFGANPVTAQAILTTHPDTVVVPYLTALTAVLVIAERTGRRGAAALALVAGLLGGAAINSNIFSLPLVGLALGAYGLALLLRRRWVDVAVAAGCALAGIAVVSVGGMLVYSHLFDDANIYRTTFNAVNDISTSSVWRTPSYVWLETRRYVYAPLIAVGVAVVVSIRRWRRDRAIDATAWLATGIAAAMLAFYLFDEFIRRGTGMEQAYYYSYLIGPALLALCASLAPVPWIRRALPAVLAATMVSAWLSQAFAIGAFAVFALVALALVVPLWWARTAPITVAVAFFAMGLCWGTVPRTLAHIPGALFQYEPHYEIAIGDDDESAFDAYVLASRLSTVVPNDPRQPPPVVFWYPTGDAMLDAVQASYLWEVSAVQRFPAPGMPALSEGDLARLDRFVGGYLVMLARTADPIVAGEAALTDAGYVLTGTRESILHHGAATVHVVVAQLGRVAA